MNDENKKHVEDLLHIAATGFPKYPRKKLHSYEPSHAEALQLSVLCILLFLSILIGWMFYERIPV